MQKKKKEKKNQTETTDVLVGVGVYFWRARPFFLVLIPWERKRRQTAKKNYANPHYIRAKLWKINQSQRAPKTNTRTPKKVPQIHTQFL